MGKLSSIQRPNLSGIPSDWAPIVASDAADNTGDACTGVYCQNAGNVACMFEGRNDIRIIPVPAGYTIVGTIRRVRATGTTATGLFALQG